MQLVGVGDKINSSWHSGQGSIVPEITTDVRSRKKISGNAARICAQNFGTVLAVIVIWAGGMIFAFFYQEARKCSYCCFWTCYIFRDAFLKKLLSIAKGPGPGPGPACMPQMHLDDKRDTRMIRQICLSIRQLCLSIRQICLSIRLICLSIRQIS